MVGRSVTLADRFIGHLDRSLRAICGGVVSSERPSPAGPLEEPVLSEEERRLVIGLMRVNHAGEVAAQALYHGQALTARRVGVRGALEKAAVEENDHLVWCRERLKQLGGRPSMLDPLWYTGAFLMGAVAGRIGDRWNLGFLAETERQVVEHLDGHLKRLPISDVRSRSILQTMRRDEAAHATTALERGAIELPSVIKRCMRMASKVMTSSAYWV